MVAENAGALLVFFKGGGINLSFLTPLPFNCERKKEKTKENLLH